MQTNPNAPPVNPLPPVVVVLALAIFGIELAVDMGRAGYIGGPAAIGWRLGLIRDYSFLPQVFHWMIANRTAPLDQMMRFASYPFVQISFTQMLFVAVFLLALGKAVGEVFRAWAVLAVFFGAAIMGALAYGLFATTTRPLIGGFPAVYGLIGAFTFLLWVNLIATGGNKYRAFALIGFLLAIQLVFGIFFGGSQEWIADMAGFATGFGLSFVVSPGGSRRALAYLRRR